MMELKERGGTGLIQLFITYQNYFGCLFSYWNLLPRRGCFSITPRWARTATAGTDLRGVAAEE